MERKPGEKPDIREKGAPVGGRPQTSERRLFMQLLAFGACGGRTPLIDALSSASIEAALYEDINDPQGVGILTLSEDPDFFISTLRPLLSTAPFVSLTPKPEYTMFGRTYSIGYEPDLNEALLHRPRRTALNADWPWVIWYPLRRRGTFAQLDGDEQRRILMEHGSIGRSFGNADFAHDIRLACHGLDRNDNDFVIGLSGSQLYPLSAIVQTMRRTQQTSLYLERLGPFFIGKAAWQSEILSLAG